MKKFIYVFLAVAALASAACRKEEKIKINQVTVSTFIDEAPLTDVIDITLTDKSSATAYKAKTVNGVATFNVVAGIYEAATTFYKDGSVYNGVNPSVTVTDGAENSFKLNLVASTASQVIIKELYYGGCMSNDGTKHYHYDKYCILYNNSAVEADAGKFCVAYTQGNAHATNSKFMTDGAPNYKDSIPATCAYWWFQTDVKIPPYSQIAIVLNGAIDHTATYSNSVDLSHADYVTYNPEQFELVNYHPAPSANIPASHYLDTYKYGMGKAWTPSVSSPGFFIFAPEGVTGKDYATNPESIRYAGTAHAAAMIPVRWIRDAVEVFEFANLAKSNKRFLDKVDAGYICGTNKSGYSIYRNVDKAATEALEENKGKLVYDYAGGTQDIEGGTTDPSGIDAEASIAKGAHIIYKDTNHSGNDFHQRKKASLKK